MSNFYCEICGEVILDSADGYVTQCEHYPFSRTDKKGEDMSKDLKDVSGKFPASQMQWKAFSSDRGVAGIFKFAQQKYGNVSSWRNRTEDSLNKYEDAMLRHYFKWKNGEEIDPESGLNHFAALAWNVLTILEFIIEDEEEKNKHKNIYVRG